MDFNINSTPFIIQWVCTLGESNGVTDYRYWSISFNTCVYVNVCTATGYPAWIGGALSNVTASPIETKFLVGINTDVSGGNNNLKFVCIGIGF